MKIKLDTYYRHRDNPTIGYAKVLEIINPNSGINTNPFKVAKCEWTYSKGDLIGLIKYFRLDDLILDK